MLQSFQKHLQQFISRDPKYRGLEDMTQLFKVEIHLLHDCNMYLSPLGPKIFVHSKVPNLLFLRY